MAYPTLNQNEVISALYNQIISIQTEANNVKGVYGKLLEAMRVDGSMLGDTKLFIDTDCLESAAWGKDAEAANLLALNRPVAPSTQALVIDQFRMVFVTVDDYMTKRAFADEGSFSGFNSVVRGWVAETKRIYDATTFNAYVGTHESTATVHEIEIDPDNYPSLGQAVGKEVADLMIKLEDVSRDFNEYGYLRSYAPEDIIIVWNAEKSNEIKKVDLPALFHNEGLVDKFEEYVLPARYFGTVNGTTKTTADAKTRALEECVVGTDANRKHYFAGDAIATGTTLVSSGTIVVKSYQEDDSIIGKVMCKGSIPFMSGFSVGTSFYNPRSLTENQYLIWSHNSIAYLKGKPYITLKEAE